MKEQGLIQVFTGDGKGKSTAAIGQAARAAGHGFKVGLVSFFKDPEAFGYGEHKSLEKLGIKAFLPLWSIKAEELIEEFLKLKFKAIIVATRLEENFLGKVLDKALVRQISKLGSHPCGENGEYHTFVTDGPIFRKALKVTRGETKERDNVWFWDISAELQ